MNRAEFFEQLASLADTFPKDDALTVAQIAKLARNDGLPVTKECGTDQIVRALQAAAYYPSRAAYILAAFEGAWEQYILPHTHISEEDMNREARALFTRAIFQETHLGSSHGQERLLRNVGNKTVRQLAMMSEAELLQTFQYKRHVQVVKAALERLANREL